MAANVAQTMAGASNALRVQQPNPQASTSAALGGTNSFTRGSKGFSNGRMRPKFSKPLPALEINKGTEQAYVHVQYVFKPGKNSNLLEPVTVTVSTPLSVVARVMSPSRILDLADQTELKKELGELFKLPSPEREDVSVEVDIKRHPFADLYVGERWQELQGEKNWDGLLVDENGKGFKGPVDPVLRGELIRYGEFAQATYDAFDNDPNSKFCGNSKFDKEKLLEEVGLPNRGYEIVQFLYATADLHLPNFFRKSDVPDEEKWSKDSNFMGFVAVCTSPQELRRLGRRDIVVAWRGTVTKLEWLENVRDVFSPAGVDPRRSEVDDPVMVESGFLSLYKSSNENSRYNKQSARAQVLQAVKNLVQKYKDEQLSITVTGHSLGSALSLLCAYDIAESGINKREQSPKVERHWDEQSPQLDDRLQKISLNDKALNHNRVPVSVISFAGPRVGNSGFKTRMEQLGVKVLRVVETHDIVPKVPGMVFNEKLEFLHTVCKLLPDSYNHVGKELRLDSLVSAYLKDTTDPINAHNLEAYLHLLDGYHGPGDRFSPAVRRDIALVNKASAFLDPKFGIPEYWWEDKKMVLDKDTLHWVVAGDEEQAAGSDCLD